MNISIPIKISVRNLLASKMRSFLTILGIIIGVASVIMIMAAGISGQDLILNEIRGIGSNLVAVLPGASDEKGPPAAAFGISINTLTYDDLLALTNGRNVPEVIAGTGYVRGTYSIKSAKEETVTSGVGVTASYMDVEDATLNKGRFFTKEEEINLSRVAVLGNKVAKDLFGDEDAINKKIKVKDQNFTVIGVLAERGAGGFGSSNQDESVFFPLKSFQKIISGIDHLGYMRLKVRDEFSIGLAKKNIEVTLRERHGIDNPANDDFSVRDQSSAIKTFETITNVLRYFLLVIGSISLVVGGVGIMNIMLIAVSQRIKEIGLRKALGAKNRDIAIQFLVEAATVSLIGGLVGIILGIMLSYLAAIIIRLFDLEWRFMISFWSLPISVLVSIGIGLIFGYYPARKASKISPMEALRYE